MWFSNSHECSRTHGQTDLPGAEVRSRAEFF